MTVLPLPAQRPHYFTNMKSSLHSPHRGVALIIVLVILSMLTILLVAFFSFAKAESRNAHAYASTVEAQALSDTALNVFIAQLREATTGLGTDHTWASQPGMIRRYDDSGNITRIHTLYTSDQMVREVNAATFDADGEIPPADWQSNPGNFVDLNEPQPIYEADGQKISRYAYPIIHPKAIDSISGFEVEAPPGGFISYKSEAGDAQHIPMPVRWLYRLKNGEVVAPTGGTGQKVTIASATKANPVVGRIAFWADDESCKVNINTASEGKYWDIPRTNSLAELHFANRQPVVNEFQRYPGHPATTSLSPILGKWLGDPGKFGTGSQAASIYERYFKLTPRILHGGSMKALGQASSYRDEHNGLIDSNTYHNYEINPADDTERLYASVDEYIFNASNRAKNDSFQAIPDVPRDIIEQTRFFLTASSKAPEVNLFNQPRVALWPLQADTKDRNIVDKLIAFCASTKNGEEAYYFQRPTVHQGSNFSSSQSTDAFWSVQRNQDLYEYFDTLMGRKIPGFGGSLGSKFGADTEQINTMMVDYLRAGVNTSAYGKATARSNVGYTYVPPRQRSPLSNQGSVGESQVVPLKLSNTMGFGRFPTITEASLVIYPTSYTQGASGFVDNIPGPERNLKGFKAKTVKAFLLLEFFNPTPGLPSWSPLMKIEAKGLDGFGLSEGGSLNMPSNASVVYDTVLSSPTWSDTPGASTTRIGHGNNTPHFGMFQPFYTGGINPVVDGNIQNTYTFHSTANCAISPTKSPATDNDMTLISDKELVFTIRSAVTNQIVQTVNMKFPQTMPIPRPYVWANQNATPAAPGIAQGYETSLQLRLSPIPAPTNKSQSGEYFWSLIRPGDVVRSMEADKDAVPKGDLRFYSATPNVPAAWFRPGGMHVGEHGESLEQWNSTNPLRGRYAHGLRNYNEWQFHGQFQSLPFKPIDNDSIGSYFEAHRHPFYRMEAMRTAGSLIPNHHLYRNGGGEQWSVYRDAHFVTARGLKGAFRSDGAAGDFDTGFGFVADGPYINKPDLGNAFSPNGQSSFEGSHQKRVGGYYNLGAYDNDNLGISLVPNRQIASAVQFGSLPAGLKRGLPWQTLLFTSMPSGPNHPGAKSPADHLLLDWWWMPVAQPYPISQPLATAGKINLNYDILPFRYIKRRSPIHSLLKGVEIGAIPPYFASYGSYNGKNNNYRQGLDKPVSKASRYAINPDSKTGTLKGFEDKFASGRIFRSPSEICEINLVPQYIEEMKNIYPPRHSDGASYDKMDKWWRGSGLDDSLSMSLTGDNMREAPYNHIYPRCTTKSNTYRVHMRVEQITWAEDDNPTEIDLETDLVVGSYRGSALVERFVDPNDPDLPDFIKNPDASLDDYYSYRIISKEAFKP